MKYLPIKLPVFLAAFLFGASIVGQTPELPPLDESQFSDPNSVPAPGPAADSATPPADLENPQTRPDPGSEPDLGPEPDLSASSIDAGGIKTSIIDAVQVSSEPGENPGEKAVTCYFIFQDKPSSYFYEVRLKEKKIVFEFNDTRKGDAPFNFTAEPPIKNFTIEQKQVNVNKDIKGLKPEYHTQVRVTFNVTDVPKIQVSDEFNVISFTYTWSNDPAKLKEYIVTDNKPTIIIWSAASVAAAIGGGTLAYFLIGPPKPPPFGQLPLKDLPKHPDQ